MTRWQTWLRVAIAVFGIAFAGYLFLSMRDVNPPRTTPPGPSRSDAEATLETTKGNVENLGAKGRKWDVESDRSLTYPDGRQKLTNIRATVPYRDGRIFKLKAGEAEVGPNNEQMLVKGAVEMTSSDGLVAQTEEASFNQKEGVLRSPKHFYFRRKNLSGSSTGMAYDQNADIMWFLANTVLKMTPKTADGVLTTIDAGSGSMARRDHYSRFEGGFKLVSGARVIECDNATAFLTDDDARVTALEMRGNSRISGVGEGAGAVRGMQATDANLEFAEDGRTLVAATLAGAASVDMGDGGSGSRRIQAEWIEIRLGADGTTVSALTARDRLVLSLPASKDEPERVIRAQSLTARGDGGKGLTNANLVGDVVYRENRAAFQAGRSNRLVTAKTMDLLTQPGLGDIDEAKFGGGVRFSDDPMSSTSDTARYQVKNGTVVLTGIEDGVSPRPKVGDGQVSIEAQVIAMNVDKRQVTADGDVHSTMSAASTKAPGGGTQVHRASMLKGDQPVYAMAFRLIYDGVAHTASYIKDARLWQGDTAISADRIAVDDASGNLNATGGVRSVMVLEQLSASTKKTERVSTVSVAETMTYDESKRRATYTTNAHATGPQGDLRAETIQMYLKASGNELERIEAFTKVVTKDPSRWAAGDKMTYFADEERYEMTGKPVRLCADSQETTGGILGFKKSSNTIWVDGTIETRTQMKAGTKCGEPPK